MPKNEQSVFSTNFRPVVTKRACEAIYEQVKELISKGELNPGDRLPSERQMMDMFQRSRPTIREALRMLERSGYIRTIAGSNGAVVLEPNSKNVEQTMEDAIQVGHIRLADMNEYRQISEVTTVAWAAARRTEEDLSALREQLDRMKDAIGDYEAFIDMDPRFHGLLAEAAQNQLSVIMNRTFSKIKREFVKEKMGDMSAAARKKMCKRVHEMHQAIYDAVAAQDVEKAKQVMMEHLAAYEEELK